MKRLFLAASVLGMLALAGCANDAQIASANLSQDADNFKIARRIVFYNSLTDSYMLTIEGRCSQEQTGREKLAVTCKVGDTKYKKHYLGLSDNVTYFSEQLEGADVSPYHYKIVFKPSSVVPDIEIR